MTVRSVILDDEPIARERIRTLLRDFSDFEVVGEFERGGDLLRALPNLGADVLFLDLQMPGIDGFSILEALRPEERACVVFVTAHDDAAIRAFEVNAIDYLLKPFTKTRFANAIERIRARARLGENAAYKERTVRALDAIGQERGRSRIPIRGNDSTYFIPVEDIDWAESDGNHVRIHAGTHIAVVRETLTRFCERLPAPSFLRVHRRSIVNIERIVRVEPWARGEYVVVLRDGTRIRSGRAYSDDVRGLLR